LAGLQKPRSMIFKVKFLSSRKFYGFKSLCAKPFWWIKPTSDVICFKKWTAISCENACDLI